MNRVKCKKGMTWSFGRRAVRNLTDCAKTTFVSHKRLLASDVAIGYLLPSAGCFRFTVLDWLHEKTVNVENKLAAKGKLAPLD